MTCAVFMWYPSWRLVTLREGADLAQAGRTLCDTIPSFSPTDQGVHWRPALSYPATRQGRERSSVSGGSFSLAWVPRPILHHFDRVPYVPPPLDPPSSCDRRSNEHATAEWNEFKWLPDPATSFRRWW